MNKISKIIDVICLVFYLLQIVVAIAAMFGLAIITPIMYLCAVIICALFYIRELIVTKKFD